MFNVLAGTSLLLCAATTACWILSFFFAPVIEWVNPLGTVVLDYDCVLGEMGVYRTTNDSAATISPGHQSFSMNWTSPRSLDQNAHYFGPFAHYNFRFLGFGAYSIEVPSSGHHIVYVFWPCWIITLISLFLPTVWILRHRQGLAGHCRHCGYDLRATPNRCPECGTAVKSST
jgi:hypothetical protein